MKYPILIIVIVLVLQACEHEPFPAPDPVQNTGTSGSTGSTGSTGGNQSCDPDVIYFNRDILPVFQSNCAMSGCHNAASAQDGVILDTYANIMSTGGIKPYQANKSDVIEAITETDPDDRMPQPPYNPLSQAQIDILKAWVNQGAKELICNEQSCDTANVTLSQTVVPVLQKYCTGCHSGSNPSGGYDLTLKAVIQNLGMSGKLYGTVSHSTGFSPMPQGGNKLSSCDISKIRIWVNNGSLDN